MKGFLDAMTCEFSEDGAVALNSCLLDIITVARAALLNGSEGDLTQNARAVAGVLKIAGEIAERAADGCLELGRMAGLHPWPDEVDEV